MPLLYSTAIAIGWYAVGEVTQEPFNAKWGYKKVGIVLLEMIVLVARFSNADR